MGELCRDLLTCCQTLLEIGVLGVLSTGKHPNELSQVQRSNNRLQFNIKDNNKNKILREVRSAARMTKLRTEPNSFTLAPSHSTSTP